MVLPTKKQVRKDNKHFKGDIEFSSIEEALKEDLRDFGYTYYILVGCIGNKYRAAYNWHPIRKRWELGCN